VNVGSGVGVGRTNVGLEAGDGDGDEVVDPAVGVGVGLLAHVTPHVGAAGPVGRRPGIRMMAATSPIATTASATATTGEAMRLRRGRSFQPGLGCGSRSMAPV